MLLIARAASAAVCGDIGPAEAERSLVRPIVSILGESVKRGGGWIGSCCDCVVWVCGSDSGWDAGAVVAVGGAVAVAVILTLGCIGGDMMCEFEAGG